MLKKYLWIIFISMVPIVELRGAIPVSRAMGLPLVNSYIVCIIANMIPVPFIFMFARKLLIWGKDKKYIGSIFSFFLNKGEKAGHKLVGGSHGKGAYVGLMLFVGIPLPGTGAWTGTLAASILDLDFKKSIIAVMCGVLIAGIIMALVSFGVIDGLKFLM